MKIRLAAAASAVALLCAAGLALAQPTAPAAPPRFGAWGVDLTAGDRSVKPGDSFFDYANGAWFAKAEIPGDQPMAGVGIDLYNRTQAELRAVIEEDARAPKTALGAKIGGLYRSYTDEARLEALDDRPLQADLARVKAASSRSDLARLMGESQGAFGSSFFKAGVVPDAKSPDREALTLLQGGTGLPDRDYYSDPRFAAQKTAYLAYVARTLKLVGWPGDAAAQGQAVVDLETRIAEAQWPRADRRDPNKTYNPMTIAQLKAAAPGFDWDAYLRGVGAGKAARVIVFEASAFPKIARIFAKTPFQTLQAWQAFHLTDQASPYLSKRFVDSRFEMTKALSGLQALPPRWKRAVVVIDGRLGEALGQEYVARYFPPQAKSRMTALVGGLKDAMRARIERADWMSPQTRAEALKKLAALRVKVGYPDRWRSYDGLKIDAGDLYGNLRRSNQFEWRYELGKLDRPVDRDAWLLTPQTVDAYNNPRGNEIVFPAAMLQAPFFDLTADMAVNYGAIGGVIGHEITHGFDDQGRNYDSTGTLRDWWTPQDAQRFQAEAAKLAAQYEAFEPLPGVHINGKLTLGENIADLGGLLLGLDAYHASLGGRPAPVIDGLTGDQRLFLGWAQGWRDRVRDEATRAQLTADPHSPPRFRVDGSVRNIDAWYAAFDVKPGQKLYLAPADRARIW
jgi:putative endopeptidase